MLTRSRQVALLLFDEVEILDFAGTVQALTLAGRQWNWRPFKIHAVAERPGLISTCNQLRIEAPVGLADCPAPEILLVPGGYGAIRAAQSPSVVQWLQRSASGAEAVCCVSHGALLLTAAGAFNGEPVSTTAAVAEALRERNTRLLPSTVERLIAGPKLISARSSEAGIDIGLVLIERFIGGSQKRRVQAELMMESTDPAPVDVAMLQDPDQAPTQDPPTQDPEPSTP